MDGAKSGAPRGRWGCAQWEAGLQAVMVCREPGWEEGGNVWRLRLWDSVNGE